MTKIRLLIAALLATVATLGLSAQSASAIGNNTTGNQVYNYYSSTGNVYLYYGSTGQYRSWLYPGQNSYDYEKYNVQCFYPTKRATSQWGGVYNAYEVRCFASNYNQLILHVNG